MILIINISKFNRKIRYMKRLIVLFTVLVAVAVFLLKNSNGMVEKELSLENVEALAFDEYSPISCFGQGNVICSSGEKVKIVVRPFSLH